MHQSTRPTTIRPAQTTAAPPTMDGDRPRRPPNPAIDRQVDAAWLTGVISGCVRGLLAGRRHALRTVLHARFGPLPPEVSRRLSAIGPNHVEAWLKSAATAPSLTGVLSAAPANDRAGVEPRPADDGPEPEGPQRASR